MTEVEQQSQSWQLALIAEKRAVYNLSQLNPESGQISHAQAEGQIIYFLKKSGFKDLALKLQNLREERGWTYTEAT